MGCLKSGRDICKWHRRKIQEFKEMHQAVQEYKILMRMLIKWLRRRRGWEDEELRCQEWMDLWNIFLTELKPLLQTMDEESSVVAKTYCTFTSRLNLILLIGIPYIVERWYAACSSVKTTITKEKDGDVLDVHWNTFGGGCFANGSFSFSEQVKAVKVPYWV